MYIYWTMRETLYIHHRESLLIGIVILYSLFIWFELPCTLKGSALVSPNVFLYISLLDIEILFHSNRQHCSTTISTHKYYNKNGISFKLELHQWCMTGILSSSFGNTGIFIIKLCSFVVWIETKNPEKKSSFSTRYDFARMSRCQMP